MLTVTLSITGGLAPALAQSRSDFSTTSVDHHRASIAEAAQRFGIPRTWIAAVLHAESGGDVRALSPAGAMGLMQIVPGTWDMLRARYGLGEDPYDPQTNIMAGAAYLREMWDRYGNVPAMLAAYNAGPERYEQSRASGLPLPAETQTYVATVVGSLRRADAAMVPGISFGVGTDWRDAPIVVTRSPGIAPIETQSSATGSADSREEEARTSARSPTGLTETLFVKRASPGSQP